MVCRKCRATVPEGWPACPDCGEFVRQVSPDESSLESEMLPLLAGASLSRRRGNLDEAAQKCHEILKVSPHHAGVHSLLGQIYEDQGRFEDAQASYQLALDLVPGSERDRVALERLGQRQRRAGARETRASDPMGPISAEISPYRRWWIVAALAAVCVSIIVYLIHTLSHPMAAHIVAPPPPGASALSQAPAVTPAAAGPAMMDSSSDRPGAPGTTQDASTQPRTAVQPASPAPGTVSTGETVQESALEEVIASNLKSEGFPCSLLSLLQDFRPSSPNAILTVALTQPVSGPVARDTIVQALGAAADAASAARLDRVTVRIVGSIGTAPPALLLIGDANTETFKNVNPSTLTAANSASSIQNSWWNAGIPQN